MHLIFVSILRDLIIVFKVIWEAACRMNVSSAVRSWSIELWRRVVARWSSASLTVERSEISISRSCTVSRVICRGHEIHSVVLIGHVVTILHAGGEWALIIITWRASVVMLWSVSFNIYISLQTSNVHILAELTSLGGWCHPLMFIIEPWDGLSASIHRLLSTHEVHWAWTHWWMGSVTLRMMLEIHRTEVLMAPGLLWILFLGI